VAGPLAIGPLPSLHVLTDLPIPRLRRLGSRHPVVDGDLIPSEESATFWLWVWPELLGWPDAITWLFSPVVGHVRYPGDLWGVDGEGRLLIVETKLQRRGHGPQDPFGQFVDYCRATTAAKLWQAASLREHWHELLSQELAFIDTYAEALTPDAPLTGSYPGILPYSSHRATVWYWQALYRERVASHLSDSVYVQAVDRCLERRRDNRNSDPIFFGLVATTEPGNLRLSKKGLEALVELRERVGDARAHLRAIRPRRDDRDRIEIRCWTPDGITPQPPFRAVVATTGRGRLTRPTPAP